MLKGNEVATAGLLAGFVLLLVGIALLASSGTGDGGTVIGDTGAIPADGGGATGDSDATTSPDSATTSPSSATTSPSSATTSPGSPTTADTQPAAGAEEAIQVLARRSIEVLPAGQWPSLYDSFTSEFRQRCPRDEYDQAGLDAASQLGDDLRLIRFKRMESLTIEGSSARAVVVGEIVGQSEYQIQAEFQMEDDVWKIAPTPDTQGCEAFGRLGG